MVRTCCNCNAVPEWISLENLNILKWHRFILYGFIKVTIINIKTVSSLTSTSDLHCF